MGFGVVKNRSFSAKTKFDFTTASPFFVSNRKTSIPQPNTNSNAWRGKRTQPLWFSIDNDQDNLTRLEQAKKYEKPV